MRVTVQNKRSIGTTKDTTSMWLTSIKVLQRQRHDGPAKEQVSLTFVIHLQFIQGEIKYLY